MAFNASECAYEGFRVVRKHPGAFAVWCLFYLLLVIALVVAVAATMAPMFMQYAHPGAAQAAPWSDRAAAFFQNNLPIVLAGAAVLIPLIFIWSAMMVCAIYRAVLRPAETGFGYLRLGADELRMIGLYLLIWIVMLAAGLAGAGVMVGVSMAAKAQASGGAFILFGVLACLAYIFVAVRLSLCGPQTFAERRVDLFGSWRLTRGHFWGLLGMYVLVIVLVIVLQVGNVLLQLPFRAISDQISHDTMPGLAIFGVVALIYIVLAFAIGVLNLVVTEAPRAAAYRDLLPRAEDEAAKASA